MFRVGPKFSYDMEIQNMKEKKNELLLLLFLNQFG